jgi:excisionase family DNA binding protein
MSRKTESPSETESPYLRGQGAAAKYAQVSKRTISEWQARGIIPYLKPARKICLFRKKDIDAALGRYEVKAV